jgi:hypothetical protein
MPTEVELVTTADKLTALEPSLAWFIPRLLQRSIEGRVARGAAIDFLRKQQDQDADRGVDLVARAMIADLLRRFDGLSPSGRDGEPTQPAAPTSFANRPPIDAEEARQFAEESQATAQRAEGATAGDNLRRLFRCLSPEELAQLIDESTPRHELDERGRAVDALHDYTTERNGECGADLIDRDAEVVESAISFSEQKAARSR